MNEREGGGAAGEDKEVRDEWKTAALIGQGVKEEEQGMGSVDRTGWGGGGVGGVRRRG